MDKCNKITNDIEMPGMGFYDNNSDKETIANLLAENCRLNAKINSLELKNQELNIEIKKLYAKVLLNLIDDDIVQLYDNSALEKADNYIEKLEAKIEKLKTKHNCVCPLTKKDKQAERLTCTSEITGLPMASSLRMYCGFEESCGEVCDIYVENDCIGCPIQEAISKLSAYEDTGVQPEEIVPSVQEIGHINEL